MQTNDVIKKKEAYSVLQGYQDPLDIGLQWFASEDEGRSFDPTEQKLRKARQEGRVAKSNEIPASLIMLGGVGVILGFSTYYSDVFQQVFQYYLYRMRELGDISIAQEALQALFFLLRLILPLVITVFCIAIFGNVVQFGFLFSAQAIAPKWSRINISVSKWIEKSVSKQGWYVLGMSVFKIIVISAILYLNFSSRLDSITALATRSFLENLAFLSGFVGQVIIQCGVFLLIISFLDYRFQRYIFRDQLKMSRDELKKEFKETEGDPEVRQRIRRRMEEYLNRNIPEQVQNSDVVITNPTHFAVAMKYDMNDMEAPQVTAKGSDLIAFKIRKLAKELKVPIIENKPLARALYHELEVGDVIPEKYFRAVVLVFKEVYKLKGVRIHE